MSNSEPSAILLQRILCMRLFFKQLLEFFQELRPAGLCFFEELVVPGCFGPKAGLNQTEARNSSASDSM